MHWADSKTIELIDRFFSHNNSQRFLLVVGYQSFRLLASIKFKEFLTKFSKLRRRYTELELNSFSNEEAEALCQHMLSIKDPIPEEVVEFLQKNTGGNPLFLSEMIRSLVTKGYIYEDSEKQKWSYRTHELDRAELEVDSIDLMLMSLQSYDPLDRQILELASLIGSTFSFEVLLVDETMNRQVVMRALRHAQKLGLIMEIVNNDNENAKQFGKSYTFSHGRIREMIKDMIPYSKLPELHLKIVNRLESLVEAPTRQLKFTMAHHYIQATLDVDNISQDVSLKVMKYNILAGDAAMKVSSLVSAERYFSVAEDFSSHTNVAYNHPKIAEKTIKYALEKLGDISMLNTKFKRAKDYYERLLGYKVSKETYSAIVYKIYYIDFLNGRVTSTLNKLDSSLVKITGHKKSSLKLELLTLVMRLTSDGVKGKNNKLWLALDDVENGRVVRPKRKLTAIYLEQMAAHEVLETDLFRALLYHSDALKLSLNEKAPLRALLITAADHASLLVYLGFVKIAYNLFDKAAKVAERFKENDAYAYILSRRTLIADHFKNKYNDYDSNSQNIRRLSSFQKNYPTRAQHFVFDMYQNFKKANSLTADASRISSMLRTRYGQSPKAVAIHLFSKMLMGQYQVVAEHERYLDRRKKVNARDGDIFSLIIKNMIAHTSGEEEKAARYFMQILKSMHRPFHERFMLPFEEEFVSLYIVFYVDLYKLDFSKDVLGETALKQLSEIKKTLSAPRNKQRPISLLLKARISELEGLQTVKAEYDAALKETLLSGDSLYVMFAKIWFGRLLVSSGQNLRRDFIDEASELALTKELKTLERFSVEILIDNGLEEISETKSEKEEVVTDKLEELWLEHLEYIPEAEFSEVSFREALSGSFEIFAKYFEFDYIDLIFSDVKPKELGLSTTDRYSTIKAYISPYISLRSTLLLPSLDAPWNSYEDGKMSEKASFMDLSYSGAALQAATGVDKTKVLR